MIFSSDALPHQSPLLQMRDIHKRFGGTVALDGVGLEVSQGEVLALVGENGAGKSTLMKVLSGAIKADSGEMTLGNKAFMPRYPLDARRCGVAMIYQELSLALHLTVEENITLGLEPGRFGLVDRKEVRRRALQSLQHFNHPEITPQSRTGDLSVATQQLVEIARALAMGCRVLILDEPTSSLSREDVRELFELVRQLKNQGHAIIYISHFIEEVQKVADRVTVLRDGRSVGTHEVAGITVDKIVALMVGRNVKQLYPRSKRPRGEEILRVTDLAGFEKPQAVSLTLHRGEVLGIAGLVGAGRTELARVLFGLDAVRRGEIKMGLISGPAGPSRRWVEGMGLVSEDRKNEGLAQSLSVADNMTLSRLRGFGPLKLIFKRRQDRAAAHWIDLLDLRCREPGQPVSDLSGGNQQKVALARLLQHDVDVLILDEPTRGIDVGAKAIIYKVIDELATGADWAGGRPRAILMISSYIPELLGVCDRIGVMCRGRLGPIHNAGDCDEHQIMIEATGQQTAYA